MGANGSGQLGDNTQTGRSKPVMVVSSGVVAAWAGAEHSLFLKSDGTLWGMGTRYNGRLGDGIGTSATSQYYQPTPMQVAVDVVSAAALSDRSLWVTVDGKLWQTQSGNATESLVSTGVGHVFGTPQGYGYVKRDGTVVMDGALVAGWQVRTGASSGSIGSSGHQVLLTNDGRLWSYGVNTSGQLGDGTTTSPRLLANAYEVASGVMLGGARLQVNVPPRITVQPLSQNAFVGGSVTLHAEATGDAALSYQWFKNGVSIAGATGNDLPMPSVVLGDAGRYKFVATNPNAVVSSDEIVLGVVKNEPVIVKEPTPTAIFSGTAFVLSVEVTGRTPMTFQWYKNGVAITNAVTKTYSVASAAVADSGDYSVKATNDVGAALSAAAPVKVVTEAQLPEIVTPPASQQVTVGAPVGFSVVATGVGTLTYQWRKNGINLAGATASLLSIAAARDQDTGAYSVTVANERGSVTSPSASLMVATPQTSPGIKGTHVAVDLTYRAGGLVRVRNSITYSGSLSQLGWQVVLPKGWRFVSSDAVGAASPVPYEENLLEWLWTTVPAGPIVFTYTLSAPVESSGSVALSALVLSRSGTQAFTDLVLPSPAVIGGLPRLHSADINQDSRLSLGELLRVIELYNTRDQSVRTGLYSEQIDSEDGFAPGTSGTLLTRFHSADTDRNGRISLLELLRVIELFNYRVSGSRTGQYQLSSGSEDGFAPGPAN
jgi:Immunoglobulin domain